MKVKVFMVAEVEVPKLYEDSPEEGAQRQLDAFREATLPSSEWGITLYRMGFEDMEALLNTAARADRRLGPFHVVEVKS